MLKIKGKQMYKILSVFSVVCLSIFVFFFGTVLYEAYELNNEIGKVRTEAAVKWSEGSVQRSGFVESYLSSCESNLLETELEAPQVKGNESCLVLIAKEKASDFGLELEDLFNLDDVMQQSVNEIKLPKFLAFLSNVMSN